jgi:DivIVA domain-containing protein
VFVTIDTGEFPTELRGYRRSDVDAALRDLRNELVQAAKDRAQAQDDLRVVREELEALRHTGHDGTHPTLSGLGGRLEAVLRIAEEQSTSIISKADIDADAVRATAEAEARDMVARASAEAERLTQEAQASATATLEAAHEQATQVVADATAEAERLRQSAIDEAAEIRGALEE